MSKKKILLISTSIISIIAIVISLLIIFVNIKNNDNDIVANGSEIGEIIYYHTELEHIVQNKNGIMYVDNEILLVANESAQYQDIEKLAQKHNAIIVGYIEQTGDYQLQLNNSYTTDELNKLIDLLNESAYVNSAYINFASQINYNKTEERNGFIFGDEWEGDLQNFNNCKGDSWGIEAIEVLASWDVLNAYKKSVKPVKVGLIDSAFATEHEDLEFAETFYNVDNNQDHGTHVAGTMAAKTNNNEGICGVYPYGDGNLYGVSYSGICNFSENGSPITTSMFLKIAYAELILRDVKIINSSLGFNYYQWPLMYTNPEWNDQVEFLESNAYILGDFLDRLLEMGYDFVLVNAAGNDSDRSNNVVYDSKYNFWTTVITEEDYPDVYKRIIVVGAVNSEYNICNFSNGGDRIDIHAPGDTIFSTIPNNDYENKNWSGTSMAAPHVSGVAAMVWSVNENLTGAQVKEIVCGNHSFRCNSCDMVDAYMAVQEAAHMNSSNNGVNPSNGGILCWVVSADDVDTKIENATITATNTETSEVFSTTSDYMGHFELFVPIGTYSLTVKAEGYEDFIWPNDKVPYMNQIIVENNSINYLNDWIKMTPIKNTNDELPETNIPADAFEYNGHYYKFYDSVCGSWEEAKQYCEDLGGHLAVIESAEENTALYNYITSIGQKNAYFGFSDNATEGEWHWVNGEKNSYTNWHKNEPNHERANEDYAMFYWKYTDGTWNDGNFGNGTVSDDTNFICEWDSKTIPSHARSLDELAIIKESHYTGNLGDSRVFNLNGNGLIGNDNVGYRYGNEALDGTLLDNGFEVWIARWNYGDNISWASATFNLNNQYERLIGKTDIIKSYNTTNYDTTIYFYDGDTLLSSYKITPNNYQFTIDIDVSNVKELTLLVQDNIETAGGTSFALYDMFLH